jgi:putative hydrolase of the HAD superfamily
MVFDADGVLVRPNAWFVTGAAARYGVPEREFMSFIHGGFKRCTTGHARLEDALPPLLERWGVRVSAAEFIAQWVHFEHHVDAALLKRIQTIRASGVPCYLGTNQEANRAAYMRREMGLAAALDGVFASCELGARKPDRAFYERIQSALNLETGQLMLWDDSVENVAGAQACGWQAAVYSSLEDFDAQTPGLARGLQS